MFTIGVSGHRNLSNLNALSIDIDEVLNVIQASYKPKSLQIMSSLAEGADRLVVRRAMENLSGKLIVPLPLKTSDYMLDFESALSKAEFKILLEKADQVIELPTESTRETCYQAAGIYVLDHSDVLIAVWDGAPSRGIGGTGDIVTEARRREMPIAWVQTKRRSQESTSNSKKILGGVNVFYERFPNQVGEESGGL